MAQSRPDGTAEWFRDVFESDLTKLVLSVLIILSVLPFDWVRTYSMAFFAVFAVELYGRFKVLRNDIKRRAFNRVEVVFLLLRFRQAMENAATIALLNWMERRSVAFSDCSLGERATRACPIISEMMLVPMNVS